MFQKMNEPMFYSKIKFSTTSVYFASQLFLLQLEPSDVGKWVIIFFSLSLSPHFYLFAFLEFLPRWSEKQSVWDLGDFNLRKRQKLDKGNKSNEHSKILKKHSRVADIERFRRFLNVIFDAKKEKNWEESKNTKTSKQFENMLMLSSRRCLAKILKEKTLGKCRLDIKIIYLWSFTPEKTDHCFTIIT